MKKIIFFLVLLIQSNAFCQNEKSITEEQKNTSELSFKEIETIPTFNGCNNKSKNEEIKDCFNQKIAEHIAKHFKYPNKAIRKEIQGKVLVSFIISKTGEITNVKAANKTHPILEAEAIRIIKLLPRMTPGKQKGEPVNVAYTIPINFKLQ